VVAQRHGLSLVAVSILTLLVSPARAQSPALPAVLEFEHDGRDVKGFVLYATRREDGSTRRIDLGMPAKTKSGRWQLSVPMLEKGMWRLELAAYNGDGESARAKADPPEVRSDPPAPTSSPVAKPASRPSAPPQNAPSTPPKTKKGPFRKLWRVIVGADGP
jgi:hypothetical protein